MDNQPAEPAKSSDPSANQPDPRRPSGTGSRKKTARETVFSVYMVFVAILGLLGGCGIMQGFGSGILQSGISCAFSRVVVKLKSAS